MPRLVTLFLCIPLFLSCADSPDDGEIAARLVEQGKEELAQSRFQTASHTFTRALDYDDKNREAHFGFALSELITFYEQISLIVRAAGFGDLVPQREDHVGDGVVDGPTMYNKIILDVLLPLQDELEQATWALDKVQGGDFQFKTSTIPVKWNADTVVELGGTWRIGDVRALAGVAHLLSGTLNTVFTHELRLDLWDVLDYFSAYSGGFSNLSFGMAELINIAVHVFDANPEFLGLMLRDADEDGIPDGEALPKRARAHFEQSFRDFHSVSALAQKYPGQFQYEAGAGEAGKLIMANTLVVGTTVDGDLKFGEVMVPINERSQAGLQALADNLAGNGEFVGWKDHALPVIGTVAVAAANIISQLNFDLSDTIKNLLSVLKDPATVESLAISFVPDVLAFDPAAYYAAPTGLREFLPLWHPGDGLEETERSFLMEWECLGYAKDPTAPVGSTASILFYKAADEDNKNFHFTCPEDTAVDMAHFPTSATAPGASVYAAYGVEKIKSDGTASAIPYIAFADPDFGGILHLQFSDSAEGESPIGSGSFQPADQRSLNALIAEVWEGLPL